MKKVLLIDDDADDREIFQEALAALESDIVYMEAANGEDAFYKLKDMQQKPQIIFLDLNMPKMNGWEFLTEFSRRQEYNDIKVIIYSTSPVVDNISKDVLKRVLKIVPKQDSILTLRSELKYALEACA